MATGWEWSPGFDEIGGGLEYIWVGDFGWGAGGSCKYYLKLNGWMGVQG